VPLRLPWRSEGPPWLYRCEESCLVRETSSDSASTAPPCSALPLLLPRCQSTWPDSLLRRRRRRRRPSRLHCDPMAEIGSCGWRRWWTTSRALLFHVNELLFSRFHFIRSLKKFYDRKKIEKEIVNDNKEEGSED